MCWLNLDIFGRVFESGITDDVGQGNGLTVEYGYSTENTDPSTWINWTTATYHADEGNNDEYKGTLNSFPVDTFILSSGIKSALLIVIMFMVATVLLVVVFGMEQLTYQGN